MNNNFLIKKKVLFVVSTTGLLLIHGVSGIWSRLAYVLLGLGIRLVGLSMRGGAGAGQGSGTQY